MLSTTGAEHIWRLWTPPRYSQRNTPLLSPMIIHQSVSCPLKRFYIVLVQMRGLQRLKNGEIALLTRHTQLWTVVQTLTPKLPLLFSCVASYLCSRRARRSYFTFYLPITDVASTLQFMKVPKLSYRCVDERHLKSSSKLPTSAGQKSTVKNRLVPDFYPDPVSINLSLTYGPVPITTVPYPRYRRPVPKFRYLQIQGAPQRPLALMLFRAPCVHAY